LSAGAIAGISIGSAAVLVLAAALIYLCGRRGGFDKAYRKSTASYGPPPPSVVEGQYKATPKSPGNDTWGSAQYAGMVPAPARDMYQANSPPAPYGGPVSPPMSHRQSPGYGAGYPQNMGAIASPLMSNIDSSTGTY
jgi:hypothetical protein